MGVFKHRFCARLCTEIQRLNKWSPDEWLCDFGIGGHLFLHVTPCPSNWNWCFWSHADLGSLLAKQFCYNRPLPALPQMTPRACSLVKLFYRNLEGALSSLNRLDKFRCLRDDHLTLGAKTPPAIQLARPFQQSPPYLLSVPASCFFICCPQEGKSKVYPFSSELWCLVYE